MSDRPDAGRSGAVTETNQHLARRDSFLDGEDWRRRVGGELVGGLDRLRGGRERRVAWRLARGEQKNRGRDQADGATSPHHWSAQSLTRGAPKQTGNP